MKRITNSFLLLFFSIGSITTLFSQKTPVQQNGSLQVCDTQLCNQYGNPIQLRGMSTHGLQWYGWGNCLTENSLDALAYNWGSDILRISMYIQEGGYETDPVGFTDQVSRLIDEATERGMYALVDFHQLNPGDPNFNTANAQRFFKDIVERHKNNTNVIYDICNEPNGTGTTWNRIKQYADQVIPVIRAIDNDAVVLVGTHGWSTFGVSGQGTLQDVLNNPLPFDNVMYTFHFYAKSHQDAYLQRLDEASSQLPVFVTEFGSQTASGDGQNDFAMTQRFLDLMQQKKISWTNWNYSDDFRSGAVWQTGTCSGNVFDPSRLKEAGRWIRERMLSPADDFPGGDTVVKPPVNTVQIEAEDYNYMSGIQTEPCSEGGLNVGYTDAGDWLSYQTVTFPKSGEYTIEYRVASAVSGAQFSIDLNAGAIVLGKIDVPNTGGWQNWRTISHSVTVGKGTYPVGIFSIQGGWNLNWFKIKGANYKSVSGISNNAFNVYPNPATHQINFEGVSDQEVIKIYDVHGKILSVCKESKSADISFLPKGVYFARISNSKAVRFIKR